ncbi:MAG: hypothetical protein L6Q92_16530 [Phycisphaerae bacterium]|nr:hypothetical protein [Phycisphaerae bacterium]
MAPIFIRSITLSGTWQKLAATRTVLTAAITTASTNAQNAQFRVDGGPTVLWPAGVSATLIGVDLSRIEVKGTSPDSVLVTGGIAFPAVRIGTSPTGGDGGAGEEFVVGPGGTTLP